MGGVLPAVQTHQPLLHLPAGVDDSPGCTVTCKKPGTKEHRLHNFFCMKFKGRQNQMLEMEVRMVVPSGGEKELMWGGMREPFGDNV